MDLTGLSNEVILKRLVRRHRRHIELGPESSNRLESTSVMNIFISTRLSLVG